MVSDSQNPGPIHFSLNDLCEQAEGFWQRWPGARADDLGQRFVSPDEAGQLHLPLAGPRAAPMEQIGDYAFSGCSNVNSVAFNDQLEEIGSYAFRYCTGLTNLSFPQSLKKLSYSAFEIPRSRQPKSPRYLTSVVGENTSGWEEPMLG